MASPGSIVSSRKAQGEALIAHLTATMKNESPALLCYEPKSPRRIETAR